MKKYFKFQIYCRGELSNKYGYNSENWDEKQIDSCHFVFRNKATF